MLEAIQTSVKRQQSLTLLSATILALSNSIEKASNSDMLPLMLLKENLQAQFDYIESEKEWTFNFSGGGFNTIYAVDKESAISRAKEIYADSEVHNPIDATFRIATKQETMNLLSMFY